jgi:DNA-binding MarR family transcriptional regulator
VIVASDRYTDAAASRGTLHRTDLSALSLLMDAADAHVMTPGRLGASLGLSSPATTALVDRLERAGHVRRERLPSDRRAVGIRITDSAVEAGSDLYSPLVDELTAALAPVSAADLAVATRVLRLVETATHDAIATVASSSTTVRGSVRRAPEAAPHSG